MGKLMIFIDNKSGMPIYDQIYTQIKNHIISGEIAEDEPLPSIRALAKDLRISVVTTKRAYEELEREGFIYTQPAKGSFVAPKNIELIKEQNMKKIEEISGMDYDNVTEMLAVRNGLIILRIMEAL